MMCFIDVTLFRYNGQSHVTFANDVRVHSRSFMEKILIMRTQRTCYLKCHYLSSNCFALPKLWSYGL